VYPEESTQWPTPTGTATVTI